MLHGGQKGKPTLVGPLDYLFLIYTWGMKCKQCKIVQTLFTQCHHSNLPLIILKSHAQFISRGSYQTRFVVATFLT